MKNLQTYIDQINFWKKITKKPLLDINRLSQDDIDDLAQNMDSDMSPENLYCDGEISAAEARAKARMIQGAFFELKAIAVRDGKNIPNTYELY